MSQNKTTKFMLASWTATLMLATALLLFQYENIFAPQKADIARWAQPILTACAILFAWYQLSENRRQSLMNRTIELCNRYDFDPVIDKAARKIRKGFDSNSKRCDKTSLTTILNYFSSVKLQLDHDMIDEEIAKDQLQNIVADYVRMIIKSRLAEQSGLSVEYWRDMQTLHLRWRS